MYKNIQVLQHYLPWFVLLDSILNLCEKLPQIYSYSAEDVARRCSRKLAFLKILDNPQRNGKHLCWSLFLIKLQAGGLQLY